MPYADQRATGEALISLEQSKLFEEFEGQIRKRPGDPSHPSPLPAASVPRSNTAIDRVVAVDGSLVTQTLENGFPGAEASLVQLALVHIDLRKLKECTPGVIISPRVFNEMDSAKTLQVVLPGRNVIRDRDDLPPRDFFRVSVFEALQGKVVQSGHETLLETYESLISGRTSTFKCPHYDECGNSLAPATGKYTCDCSRSKEIFSTDQLRFHERFNETGSNGEPHGEVLRFLELVLLLNVLRYFRTSDSAIQVLPKIAFILDGPLAAFGQFASVAPRIREELRQIGTECKLRTGHPLLLFSLVKTGQFVEHFEQLDFDEERGPGRRYAEKTALLPSIDYIHRNIVYRPPEAKEWGKDTYFGRMVLYKSATGQRMVVNTSMTTEAGADLSNTSLEAYPGLGAILSVVDELSTYLFEGGFVPIVRAHSHAAIPLKLGGEILKSLFETNA